MSGSGLKADPFSGFPGVRISFFKTKPITEIPCEKTFWFSFFSVHPCQKQKSGEGYQSSHTFSLVEPKVVDVNPFGLAGSSRRANACRPHLRVQNQSLLPSCFCISSSSPPSTYCLPPKNVSTVFPTSPSLIMLVHTCPPGPCRRAPASPSPFNLTTITYKYFKVPASFFGNSYSVRQMLDCLPSTWQALD